MAKPGEDKSDGLEIVSIGKLYSGPWDKKYWSASRGKDRYPYSVGYRALRTHNMVTYKMEINEGLKGPLFSIISSDGQSCSGQTPDIVWESLQKKGILRVKLLHGKRFSSKIDGNEFFGFKNAFVQRLLRELVATVGGTAEQSSLISSLGSGVSVTKHHHQHGEASTDSSLLAHLEKPKNKGKRIRKPKTSNGIEKEADSHKRTPSEEHMHNDQTADTRSGSTNLKTVAEDENNHFSAKNSSPQAYCHPSGHHSKEVPEGKESRLNIADTLSHDEVSRNLCIGDEPLDRSKDVEFQGFSSTMAAADRKLPASEDTQDMKIMDLFAPDTMDVFDAGTFEFPPNTQKGRPPDCTGESAAEYVPVSEGPKPASNLEEEKVTSNTSGGKNDFDSEDQDIAKSMMTLLLPRALPLLKTFSRKKKASKTSSESTSSRKKSKKANRGADCYQDASEAPGSHPGIPCSDKQKIPIQSIHAGSDELVVPDSVEIEQSGFGVSQADLAAMDEEKSGPNSLGKPFGVDASIVMPSSPVISSYRKKPCSFNKGQENSKEMSGPIIESNLGCIPSERSISPVNDKELHIYAEEELMVQEVHCKEDLKTSTGCSEGIVDDSLEGVSSSGQTEQMEISIKAWEAGVDNASLTEAPDAAILRRQHDGPLTESIIFRSCAGCPPESNSTNFLVSSEAQPANSINLDTHNGDPFCAEATPKERPCSSYIEKNTTSSIGFLRNTDSDISQNLADPRASKEKDHKSFLGPSDSKMQKSQVCIDVELQKHQSNLGFSDFGSCSQRQGTTSSRNIGESVGCSNMNLQTDMGHNDKEENIFHFMGCYAHTLPVLSVLLRVKENEIFISTLCGNVMDGNRTLIVYRVSLNEGMVGSPSFVGHTPIFLPTSIDTFGREIAVDRSGLQLTPDGHGLVLLESIKAPYCREGKLLCPCSACRSNCLEKNAVKVVQVNHGYISIVVALKTADSVHCVLVCEPNFIVSVEESGRLRLWVMNPTWSALMEEYDLSASDCIFPCIVELKRIPNRATLVLGHNGFGEFGLWDISRRTIVARFSSPTTSVSQFLPISLFRWQRQTFVSTAAHRKMDINGIIAATQTSLSEKDESFAFVSEEGGDMAVWLLISSACSSDVRHGFRSSETKVNPVGSWELALLVENKVILGSALDSRATAVGSSAGHGIIGTGDGLVHTWELSTGTNLRNIHSFRGAGVSCIATDDSKPSGPFAVAAGNQLRLYLHSKNVS